jgi:hypothetical protein
MHQTAKRRAFLKCRIMPRRHVVAIIPFITDRMFPKTLLPNTPLIPGGSWAFWKYIDIFRLSE